MKPSSISELKKELDHQDAAQLKAICLRMAKYKKENKELLTYLLFDANDEDSYIKDLKHEITTLFEEIPNLNVYYLKKSLRKILRILNKQIKYSGIPTSELELRIHFCKQINESNLPIDKSIVLKNMYEGQLNKIYKVLDTLDEDLKYDYAREIKKIIS